MNGYVNQQVSPGVNSLLERVREYAKKMAPGEYVTEDTIATQQKNLYTTIRSILTLDEPNDFSKGFLGLVELFHEFRDGALSSSYNSRGWYNIALDKTTREDFAAWLNLFVVLSMVDLRKRLVPMNFNLDTVFRNLDDIHRERAKGIVTALTR